MHTHAQRVHFFFQSSGTENLDELVSAVMRRIGTANDQNCPQILVSEMFMNMMYFCLEQNFLISFLYVLQYEDDEGDKVLLTMDGDLASAVGHARSVGLKVTKDLLATYNLCVHIVILCFISLLCCTSLELVYQYEVLSYYT